MMRPLIWGLLLAFAVACAPRPEGGDHARALGSEPSCALEKAETSRQRNSQLEQPARRFSEDSL